MNIGSHPLYALLWSVNIKLEKETLTSALAPADLLLIRHKAQYFRQTYCSINSRPSSMPNTL